MFTKICPSCKKIQRYSTKKVLARSIKKQTMCNACSGISKRVVRPIHHCPDCGKLLVYQNTHSHDKALRLNTRCRNCGCKNNGFSQPNYNPEACKIIEAYGQEHGYNFQHAENGGEFHIQELNYWVDGYDKENNVVIEYYETAHKYRIEKDKRRQDEITRFLGCKFIIIYE